MEHPPFDAPLAPGQRPAAAVRVRKESRYAAQKKAKGDAAAAQLPPAREEATEFEEHVKERGPSPLERGENGQEEEEEEVPFSREDIMTSSVVERDPGTGVVAAFPTAPKGAFPVVKHRSEENRPLSRAPVKAVSEHPVLDAFLSQQNTEFSSDDIEKTNAKVLASMSEQAILVEQQELMTKLNPKLIEVLKRRGKEKAAKQATFAKNAAAEPIAPQPKVEEDKALRNIASAEALTLPSLEADKLAWMYKPADAAEASTTLRFDFNGNLVPAGATIAPHEGLHHHGENPNAAGYTLKELFLLARSTVAAQRAIALKIIGAILANSESPALKTADVRHRLGRLDVVVLLRCSLDDAQVSVLLPALDAVSALIGDPHAESYYSATEALHRGWEVQPTYSDAEELVDEELEGAELSDAELAREDPLVGLLRMGLLLRVRFLLNAHRAVPALRERVRDLLLPLARHSAHAALHVLECPGFLSLFMSVFIEGSAPDARSVRVLRALAQASRVIAEKLSSEGPILALNRYLLQPKGNTPEEEVLFRETMLLWRVCVEYGLSASLFLDLFPVLSKRLVARDAHSAVIFATGESLIHACAKSAGITWPQPLALLDPALALIAEMRLQTNAPLTLVAAAVSYIAAYFEHCATQPAYSESANAQLVRLHVIPLCLSPLFTHSLNALLMRVFSLPSVNSLTDEIFALCELVSSVARLLTRVRQVLPTYLAPIQSGGAYEANGQAFLSKLQQVCIALCFLPLPVTREELLSTSSLRLRPVTRMQQYSYGLLAALPPLGDPTAFHRAALSFIPRLLPGDETFFADILAGIVFNASVAGAKLALPLLLEFFLLRFCPDRTLIAKFSSAFKRSLALTSSDVLSRQSLMLPISQTVLPAPLDWLLQPLSQALAIVEKGDAIPPRHVRAIRDLLSFVAAHPPGLGGQPGPTREVCIVDVCKFFLLETELQNDKDTGAVLMRLLQAYTSVGAMSFDRNAPGAYALWLQLVDQYAAASFGDPVFSAYVYLFLTTNEPVEYRKALFVGQSHALAALAAHAPPLPLSAYLEPPDTDEAQLRSLIAAVAADRVTNGTSLYSIALHHVAAFLFRDQGGNGDAWMRTELCKTVVRTWASKPHALIDLLTADANKGPARAARIKFVEASVSNDAELKAAFEAALVSRP